MDLPFPLVCRIAAWQRDFDNTVMPANEACDEWSERHAAEEIEIAQALQMAVGSEVAVKRYCPDGWVTVDQIVHVKGYES